MSLNVVVLAEDGTKRHCISSVPSPSRADSIQGPAKPESTAISSGVSYIWMLWELGCVGQILM